LLRNAHNSPFGKEIDLLINWVIFLCLASYMLAPYLVWPSVRNLYTHIQVPIVFSAYLIPVFFTETIDQADHQVLDLYVKILVIGAFSYVFGVILGYLLPQIRIIKRTSIFSDPDAIGAFTSNIRYLTIAALIVIILCFFYMGYVPMFASDPLAAKFFRGAYQDRYSSIALFYRPAFFIVSLNSAFVFAIYIARRTLSDLILLIAVVVVLALTLNRGPVLFGILLTLGVYSVFRKKVLLFISAYTFVFIFGALAYAAMFYLLGNTDDFLFTAQAIADGTPDLSDHLYFLEKFSASNDFTYGRTFLGGMIPFQYEWNPSVWTLRVLGSDPNEAVSGGLRLPVSIWGYVSFSWLGVVAVSFLSGVGNGYLTKFLKRHFYDGDVLRTLVAYMYATNNIAFFAGFYWMSIYSIPTMTAIIYYVYYNRLRFRFFNPRIS